MRDHDDRHHGAQADRYGQITGRWWTLDVVPVVGQAVGLAAAQLDVSQAEAALLLRAHAAAHAQDPVDVALDVVNGLLRFSP